MRSILCAAMVLALGPFMIGEARAAPEFSVWLKGVRTEGLKRGLSAATLDQALKGLKPIPRVIEYDRKQPEFTLTLEQYLARAVSPRRIAAGKLALNKNRKILRQVAVKYGVQPRFIVALWGMESSYGRLKGRYKVIAALATLAHDGRRSAFFRKELFAALRIVQDGHIPLARMMGSWAGAMGQNQFMPSSYLRFAVDHDGDGRRDIWRSRADIFASSANYLAKHGWRAGQTWGRRVRLPSGFDTKLAGLRVRKTLPEWQKLGVRRANGTALPKSTLVASIVRPGETKGPAYLVYDNFRTVMAWNRSIFFAVAVGRLSDNLVGR